MKQAIFGILLVVGLASPAWSECAWVLWQDIIVMEPELPGRPTEVEFRMIGAEESKAACMKQQQAAINHYTSDSQKLPSDPAIKSKTLNDGRILSEGPNFRSISGFTCWPDTIDPRAAKAIH